MTMQRWQHQGAPANTALPTRRHMGAEGIVRFMQYLIPRHTGGSPALRMSSPSLFRVPLACGSFMFFHLVKWLFNQVRRARERNTESLDWRTISEVLGQPLALPYIMITGPRWNPHALISRVGPFQVKHGLRIRVDTAHRSARMWTLVISCISDPRAVASIISNSVARDDVWHEQTLPPGRYSGTCRYYEWSDAPRLPEIEIDSSRRIPERSVPSNENDYLGGLLNKSGIFYTCLHYYVLEMLRLRRHLPQSFVRREYLPVGNPETAFLYGYLRRGQCVEITSSHGIPDGHLLYLTIYNRSSFPVIWSEVRSLPYRTRPAEATGSYLLRLHAIRSSQTPPLWPEHLQVSTR
jgi:hypothetical protein